MSSGTYSLVVEAVDGPLVRLKYKLGADEASLSKNLSYWLMVLAEGINSLELEGPLADAIDTYEVAEDPDVDARREKRSAKYVKSVAIDAKGEKAKDEPRRLRFEKLDSRATVSVVLTMTAPEWAEHLSAKQEWSGGAYDSSTSDSAEWDDEAGDDEDDGDDE